MARRSALALLASTLALGGGVYAGAANTRNAEILALIKERVDGKKSSGMVVPQRGGRQITLQDLSAQRSGLPRMPTNFKPADMNNPYADYTVEQMYAFLSGYELTRDIGSQYEYSNLGVGLLGHALALRARTSYEALVTERILKPLGMTHTGITLTPWMKAHLAQGHNAAGAVVPNWDLPTLAGAGALRSTMNDMLRFARANLEGNAGRLQKVMQQTHQPRGPTTTPNLSVALGWHIRRMNEHDIVWHNGGTAGYRTWLGFDASRRIAAVVLTNSGQSADDIGYTLMTTAGRAQPLAEPNFNDFRDRNRTFSAVARYASGVTPVGGGRRTDAGNRSRGEPEVLRRPHDATGECVRAKTWGGPASTGACSRTSARRASVKAASDITTSRTATS